MSGVRAWAAGLVGCLVLAAGPAVAQGNTDGKVVGSAPDAGFSANECWSQLEESFRSKHTDERINAINALSLLGGNARAEGMVRDAINDKTADIDVRLAAIVAAGQMEKDHAQAGHFREQLRTLVDDDDPKLSFAAANTLWALHDPAGQALLMATAEGERASDYSFWKRSTHTASRTLHSPEALAKIAVQQSLVILVPPVGMGMGAYGYLKGAPGVSPQVTAIVDLSRAHSPEIRKAMIAAAGTKDRGARIAAAEALSRYSGPDVREALYKLTLEDNTQVRLTASAAFLRSSTFPATREK